MCNIRINVKIVSKRKLDEAGASEINRLYPESRRKDEKKNQYLKSFPLQGEAGGRERLNEDETGVTSRGREWKSAGRGGNSPKTRSRSTKNAVGRKMMLIFFAAGMKKKRVCKEKLTDATAGGTKLEPALTLIPVLMRGKCI
ncbi:hypothetical protein TNCV_2208701 [Trichonephila clavipes]|nr:hypothetical protein TNCV_2208701 [Trichonephila clavipes]